jgi:hypothetical protein
MHSRWRPGTTVPNVTALPSRTPCSGLQEGHLPRASLPQAGAEKANEATQVAASKEPMKETWYPCPAFVGWRPGQVYSRRLNGLSTGSAHSATGTRQQFSLAPLYQPSHTTRPSLLVHIRIWSKFEPAPVVNLLAHLARAARPVPRSLCRPANLGRAHRPRDRGFAVLLALVAHEDEAPLHHVHLLLRPGAAPGWPWHPCRARRSPG